MQLPKALLDSLEDVAGFDKEAFQKVHDDGEQITSIRINPNKISIPDFAFSISDKVPWSHFGFYLEKRPSFTFDPLFHAGCYYVQEASSMFLEQALKKLVDLSQPLKVLDLSAAPGGKSTHIQSLISKESLLVSNEVIRPRCTVLIDNIVKWGCTNVIVSNNDPAAFKKLPGYFDVIVVDAPCSGSGLFRKDPEAIREWSENNVALCSQRQQRILADVFPSLKENGLLIYSTCSYSKEEDEEIGDWLVEEFKMKNVPMDIGIIIENDWGIVKSQSDITQSYGYRFYPDKVKGEGFFISCFRKNREENESRIKPFKIEKVTVKEKAIVQSWLKANNIELIKNGELIIALPEFLTNEYSILKSVLNIQYAGTAIGQIMKERLVPEHPLALSSIISDEMKAVELDYNNAIKYLQRQDLNITAPVAGWQLVRYQNHNLGWINALPNRINNYYPKELRILKTHDSAGFKK